MPRNNARTPQSRQAMVDAGMIVDNSSWQKWTRCRICNRRICVNNYEDHKVRLPKVRGVILCGWCAFGDSASGQGDKGDFVTALFTVMQKLSTRPCEEGKVWDEDRKRWIRMENCEKCPPCVARKVMAKSPEAKARARKEQHAQREAARQRKDSGSSPGVDEEA